MPEVETPAPTLIVYTSFPQVAPLTVTSVPKDLLYVHSSLLPPSSSAGYFTDMCVYAYKLPLGWTSYQKLG